MCWNCGAPLPEQEKIYRSSLCPSCGKELKVCLNCRFYEPGAHWDCRETIPDQVREKDRANFCDYFSPAADRTRDNRSGSSSAARSRFDSLFGDS